MTSSAIKPRITIDPLILEQAADWLVQLHSSPASEADRIACKQWQQISQEHALAWQRAELIMNKFDGVPPSLAMPALARRPDANRRATVIKLAALMATVPVGWLVWCKLDMGSCADHCTDVGQRRDVRLADGSALALNTDTAVDVHFDTHTRRLALQQGEILVATATDKVMSHRAFSVTSKQGTMEALGTRFSVRQQDGVTHLAVYEGAVRITPKAKSTMPLIVYAGEQTTFSEHAIKPVSAADELQTSWRHGMLVADNMRLQDFAAELTRYRPGTLRVESDVVDLRVSGSYPIDDTDQTLAMLVTTYPLDAVTRFGGRWVTFVPRLVNLETNNHLPR